MNKYNISSRLTFSNSLLKEEHLSDKKCNHLCEVFDKDYEPNYSPNNSEYSTKNGIIVYSDLLLEYIKDRYPGFYFVSSTTKVLTNFQEFLNELNREEFSYVVPDFRLNKSLDKLSSLSDKHKDKVEFLCNECCDYECLNRKACYENVSHKSLGDNVSDHICSSPNASNGYVFSKAMKNPGFIGINDIQDTYLPMGFSNFKIEGRSLGSALILEFILYYMVKPEFQLNVREHIYLDNSLDLF